MKRFALAALFCAVTAAITVRPAQAEADLDVGSKAPALDIAHYFDESDAKVTKFKKDNVYVVEFWATWCPPCVASMPHLAELQQKHRPDNVHIVSISDEDRETITEKLQEPYPGKEQSFAEVTAPYTLTSDPDGSSHRDYMLAAGQNGIPAAFIVGKSGVIEWIGHPMELDEPLAQVIDDSWDREAFKQERLQEEQFQEALQKFAQLAGRGNVEEAGKMLETQISETTNEEFKERWTNIRYQFRLLTGTAGEEDFKHYREQLKELKGNGPAVYRFSMQLYGISQNDGDLGPLVDDVLTALKTEVETIEGSENKVALHEAIARFYALKKDYKSAVAAQEKAIEVGDELSSTQKRRLQLLLDELKGMLEGDDDKSNEDTPSEE
ncbi:TlpA disulfide reductase family protein [Roseiconus lacunae]|uniref:TlpA disulfide reductase family protein n=1 Tax=Roseiconus lacunae TaxID=2605694 RepID=UPI001E5E33EA|nr:TlpA disulfide reductase family protein [Roseiconus lacunae]MCD0460573.1 TlpA family protein disulfide reductase [Roseiconus lacunae]